jgi:RNA polymerase-binding transcription factor DksA
MKKRKRLLKRPRPKKIKTPKGKSPFPRAVLNEFKRLLIERRNRLKGTVTKLGEKTLGTNPKEASGDISTLPIHMADVGSDVFEHDMNIGFVESGAEELEKIEEALEKIARGEYGLCEICKKPIAKQRLKIMPHTRLCIECKKREEGLR